MADSVAPSSRIDELRASGNLPSPKGVALEILRLSHTENVSNADIVRVLKADPALAGRVLRAANSATLGLRRPIVSLGDAVMMLGLPIVRQLVLGFSLVTQYRGGSCTAFDYQRFWSESLVCGLAAQLVATRLRVAAPEELFACGLLSQVGRLALATVFPVEYSALLSQYGTAPETDLRLLEQQSFATDHIEVTVNMLQDWGLPGIFLHAVAAHEDPEQSQLEEGSRLFLIAHALHFARALCEVSFGVEADRALLGPRAVRKAIRIGLDVDTINQLSDTLAQQWADWAPLLELPAVDILPITDTNESVPGAGPELAGAADYPLRILAVDDDPAILTVLRGLLTAAGHTVTTVGSGKEALEAAVRFHPQLVIADLNMPQMDGIELCRALRSSQIGKSMHMLVLTAFEDEEHLVQAFEAGVDDYMVKPLRPRTLSARLRAAQRLLHMQEEHERHVAEMRSLASELALNNRRLQQAAMTDSLTGLPNRRCAIDRLEQEWAGARRRGSPLSCIVIDVDHFKTVNDTYGHDAGDALLRHIAGVLRSSARLPDAVCRIGGEEFIVICPDTVIADAHKLAERLRAAVSGNALKFDALQLSCTISLGAASADAAINSPTDLLRKADQAVYLAKKDGRNITRLARAG